MILLLSLKPDQIGIISEFATHAWKEAWSVIHTNFGKSIIATRLVLKDNRKNDIEIFPVSAYASVGVADAQMWDIFLQNFFQVL